MNLLRKSLNNCVFIPSTYSFTSSTSPLVCSALIRIITATLSFCLSSLFPFPPRPIQPLSHIFNRLHHLLQHRLILEKDHLARRLLKRLLRHVQPLVDQQQQRGTIGGTHLFYLPSQVLRMPEAHQLDHNFPLFILIVDQNKVRDHHRISQQEHLTLAGELPVSSFIPHFLLELARKVLLQAAVILGNRHC